MGVRGQCQSRAAPPPPPASERDHVSTVQEAGYAPEPLWAGVEKFASTGIRSPERPARSESLYRLQLSRLKL
jgi:hypothetical protein